MTFDSEQIFDDATVEKIAAYVEREAGRDAPMSIDDQNQVHQLLDSDPAAQKLADEFRTLNHDLESLFDHRDIDVPDHLIELVRTYEGPDAEDMSDREARGPIIPFLQPPANDAPARTYRRLAAAAAVVIAFAGAGLLYQHSAHNHEQERFREILAQRTSELEHALDRQASGSDHRLTRLERLTTEVGETLFAREQELTNARSQLAEAKRLSRKLEQARLAAAQQSQAQIGGFEQQLAENKLRIDSLESTINESLTRIMSLNTTNASLAAQRDRYRNEADWLNQVAEYHRGYAGTMREVEVSAEQQDKKQMLTRWLASMMGQDFPVPDLSAASFTFIGGRVFFVNGKPVGQIAYHDPEGRLTGFCFTSSDEQPYEADDLAVTRNGDLNLVSWTKGGMDYVVIGWKDVLELQWIAEGLQKSYGDEV